MIQIKFRCECGKKLSATEDQADRIGKCPKCGKKFRIPSLDVFQRKQTEPSAVEEAPAQHVRANVERAGPEQELPPPPPVPATVEKESTLLLTSEGTRLCPICFEEIELNARRCVLCRSDLQTAAARKIAADFMKPGRGGRTPFEKALKEEKSRMCPQCAEMIHPMAHKCPHCRKELHEK